VVADRFGAVRVSAGEDRFRGTAARRRIAKRTVFPVSIFLEADPLVALASALTTHALYTGLL